MNEASTEEVLVTSARYAIRGGEEGRRRLDLLARTMAPNTEALLRAAGVREGMRCLDFGCGGGHVSRFIARVVGETGEVIGIDLDPVKLASARAACLEEAGDAASTDVSESRSRDSLRGAARVEFRQGDLAAWSETAAYDLIYGRFILSHLSDRARLVSRMVAALRPDGLLVLEDIDFGGSFCHPAHDVFQRYCDLYRALIARRGGDADLGPHLHGLCVDAGLADVAMRVVQPAHAGLAPEKELSLATLINIREAAIAEGLASAEEVDAMIDALARVTADPRSIISVPRIFQVWGRRARGADEDTARSE